MFIRKLILNHFHLVILLLLVPFFRVNAFEQNFKILKETPTYLKIHYTNQLIRIDTFYISAQRFLKPILPHTIQKEDHPSKPATFIAIAPIALPSPNGYYIKRFDIEKVIFVEGKIIPVNENDFNKFSPKFNPLVFENEIQIDTIKINYLGISRNLHLGQLEIPVIQFLPNQNKIQIILEATIEIEFPETSNQNVFEDIFIRVLNFSQAKKWILPLQFDKKFSSKKTYDELLVSNEKVVKIKVEKEGIYKIDAGMLAALGISLQPNDIITLKLFGGNGKPLSELPTDAFNYEFSDIPIIVETKPSGELDYILFYGVGTSGFEFNGKDFQYYSNPYGNINYYYLAWGDSPGKRMNVDTSSSFCLEPIIQTTYTERIAYKEELTNPFSSGSGRIWFGASIFPRTFTNLLDNLDRSKSIFYRFYVAQKYQSEQTQNKGIFTFYESANLLGQVKINSSFSGSYEEARGAFFQAEFDANKIANGNRSYLKIEYQADEPAKATPYFNHYEIHYSRQLLAKDNFISFFTDPKLSGCNIFQILNFSSKPIGLEITDPLNPIKLQNQSPIANTFFIQTHLEPNSPKRFIVASQFLKPEISLINYENLRSKNLNSDVIVITHSSFVNSASKYIQYRSGKSNLKFKLITIESIFEEFSFGIPDPMAIRYFLAYLMKTQEIKPHYVLLWGDGHFDYKNITTNQPNFIPPYESFDSFNSFNSTVNFTSDDYFAYLVGNDNVIDVSIARIPISNDQMGLTYLKKIQDYESQSYPGTWFSTMLLTADDSPANIADNIYDGATHTKTSEILSTNSIPADIFQKKIYLVEYPTERIQSGRRKPLATNELINTINDGVLIVNWTGHGNPRVWAHEEFFDRDKTISQMINKDRLFFGIAATCDFGRFDMTNISSGTENLIFSPKGGAIGFFTASRAVYVSENSTINQIFLSYLFQRNKSSHYDNLGDIYLNVKSQRSGSNDVKYHLFCDPLLKLNLPDYTIELTQINGKNLDSTNKVVEIKAMSKLNLNGFIASPADHTELTNFNGTIDIIINDVSYIKNVNDVDNSLHQILKEGGIIARGIFPVQNGRFSANLIIPEELSYLDGNISIRFFAKDTTTKTFAKGYFNNIRINGIDTTLTIDNTPPKIKIFLNDTTFNENDIVSNPPLLIVYLWDDSAVNTTGSGIGHRIECWIDNKDESIDLTEKFENSPDDPKTGVVKTIIYGLTPGEHIIKVRAWDIFNNFTIAESKFRILDDSKGIYLSNLSTYPNPANNHLIFKFQHNLKEPFTFQIDVFNNFGSLVFSTFQESNKLLTVEYPWEIIDGAGNPLPSGIYYYKITIFTNDKMNFDFGKFAIIR